MEDERVGFLDNVVHYYNRQINLYGETPRGVDWNSKESQEIRFTKLLEILDPSSVPFSVNDLGCGYGALLDFLGQKYSHFRYTGIDVSTEMINSARKKWSHSEGVNWINSSKPDQIADYGVASGIFNVRLDRTDLEWSSYFKETLRAMASTSRKGFAFNALSSYSDEDKKQSYLFYADPAHFLSFCRENFSRDVILLENYELFEFTILVRK